DTRAGSASGSIVTPTGTSSPGWCGRRTARSRRRPGRRGWRRTRTRAGGAGAGADPGGVEPGGVDEGVAPRLPPGECLPFAQGGPVNFAYSDKVKKLQQQVQEFMDAHVYPSESVYYAQVEANRWAPPPIMEELKAKAGGAGLGNLFLSE